MTEPSSRAKNWLRDSIMVMEIRAIFERRLHNTLSLMGLVNTIMDRRGGPQTLIATYKQI